MILFDIDFTLVRTLGAGRQAMDGAFRSLHGIDDSTAGIRFDGRTDHAIFRQVIELHGLANGDLETAYQAIAEAYLALLPKALREKQGVVLPGVIETLDALAATDAGVGLATGNIRRGAQLKLGHFGLWERFAGGGFGDSHSIRAEVVAEAITALAAATGRDADPGQVIVIGDTPLDVEAAHLAGARALAVATGSYSLADLEASGAEHVLPDLSDTTRVRDILVG